MHFSTANEVLQWAGDFYQRLAQALAAAQKDAAAAERTKMVLQLVEQRTWEQKRAVDRYAEGEDAEHIKRVELHRHPDMSPANEAEEQLKALPTGDTDALTQAMIDIHKALERQFRAIAGTEGPGSMYQVFDSMADREVRELERMAFDLQQIDG